MNKFTLKLTILSQLFTGIGIANASPQLVNTLPSTQIQSQKIDDFTLSLADRLGLSAGDARYVRNATGAITLNIPAGEVADVLYLKLGATPQVWASYSPAGIGRIQVVKAIKNRGQVQVYIEDFAPSFGVKAIADGYHYVNPYASFASNSDNLWHNIDMSAFFTAVGKAMQKNRTAIGYVAVADVKQDVQQSSSDGLFQSSSTTTVNSYVKSKFFFATSVENGGLQAFQTAYQIQGCNPVLDPRKCLVKSGVNFVAMQGGNMPEQALLLDTQSQTVTSWSMLAQMIFTAALAYVGAVAYMGAASTGAATATMGTTATASMGAAQVAGIAAAGYGGISSALSGTACLTCAQGQWLGNVTNGVQAPTPGGFGDPSASIQQKYVAPGIVAVDPASGQAALYNRNQIKGYVDKHDPAYLIANPPLRSGVMQNYISVPR